MGVGVGGGGVITKKCDVRGRRGSTQCDGSVTGWGQNFRFMV